MNSSLVVRRGMIRGCNGSMSGAWKCLEFQRYGVKMADWKGFDVLIHCLYGLKIHRKHPVSVNNEDLKALAGNTTPGH